MNTKVFVFFLAIVGCTFAGEQDVLDLTDSDFSSRIADIDTTLVMFYAPWCGHCKRLKPEYAKAGELLRGSDPQIVLAKVDCTEGGKDTCSKFSISGYPTLKIFKNGEFSADYNGPREAAGIAKYMKAQTGPASKDLLTVAEIEDYLKVQETTVIGFFEKETDLKTVFLKYADKFREKLRFGHSSAADVLKNYKETNAIVLFRAPQYQNKFEPNSVTFKGSSLDELTTFVKENYHGLVGHRTRDLAQDFKHPFVIAYYSVDYAKNPKGTNYWRNRILKVAKEYSGDYRFAVSSKDDFQHELNEYGYDYTGEKPVVLARDKDNQKFIMTSEFSVENLQQFLSDLEEGNLEPYLKSEAIPESNDGPVKVAVAKNFDEIVTNNGKDTLIEFYAPWCGHCKKLTPVFEELGTKMSDEDVEIVKVDATANDVPPQFEVRGFPTLFWLPKDSKSKPVKYDGGREIDDFVKYISAHATNELKNFDRSGKAKKNDKTEL